MKNSQNPLSRISPISRFYHRHTDTPPRRLVFTLKRFHAPTLLTTAALTLLTLGTLITTGCQVLTYTSPTGERFTRSSLGANTSIHSLTVESSTNGVRKVHLNGYQQDQTQALGAVTDAAVKAAIQAAKP